jgi:phosphatidylglycerophosphate synthase
MDNNHLATGNLTLNDRFRRFFRPVTEWIGKQGARLGINPDLVTLMGCLITLVSAWLAGRGDFLLAGIVLIPGFLLDAVDGAIARAMDRKDCFGQLLDSTLDRYSDGFIFCGLAYYFASQGQLSTSLLAMGGLIGAFMVSYVRARAEGMGIGSIKEGFFDRAVRSIVLVIALLTGWIVPGLAILAAGAHLTAIQRIAIGYRKTRLSQNQ